jgi:carbamoylphosphate synthase large subunit
MRCDQSAGLYCHHDALCHRALPSAVPSQSGSSQVEADDFTLSLGSRKWHPDLIVPLDDYAAWLLRGLATNRSVSVELRHLLEVSLGSHSGYDAACSRTHLLELATKIGVRVPASRAVDRSGALKAAADMGFPVMVKNNQTFAGEGVAIARDLAQLEASINASDHGRDGLLL